MKKYKEHIKKHWYCFLLAPIFMTLEAAGEFILPFINANIIDQGAASGDIPYILENGVYMLLIAAAMLAFGVLGAFFAVRGSARVAAGVRRDAFARIQTFSFSDIDRFSAGSLITRVTNDITQVQTFLQTLMRGFFRSPVMLVGALVMSFRLNAEIAMVILIVLPFLAIATFLIIKTALKCKWTAIFCSCAVLFQHISDPESGAEHHTVLIRIPLMGHHCRTGTLADGAYHRLAFLCTDGTHVISYV